MPDGHPLPEDRPDPSDHAPHLRARVPDHVADGAFSTGAIVVTGPNEFIIDFLQTIGRPHRVAARVIIPHGVMPQFIEALGKNLGLYRDRFGDPPQPPGSSGPATAIGATGVPQESTGAGPGGAGAFGASGSAGAAAAAGTSDVMPGAAIPPAQTPENALGDQAESATGETAPPESPSHGLSSHGPSSHEGGGGQPGATGLPSARRPTPQEIYDDLKIPDSVLSGAYANGVMIGHGASEFGFDFLTSFYPQSAVSARVFMAAGQVPRLLDSLHHAMRQLQHQRRQQLGRPDQPPPPKPDDRSPDDDEQ